MKKFLSHFERNFRNFLISLRKLKLVCMFLETPWGKCEKILDYLKKYLKNSEKFWTNFSGILRSVKKEIFYDFLMNFGKITGKCCKTFMKIFEIFYNDFIDVFRTFWWYFVKNDKRIVENLETDEKLLNWFQQTLRHFLRYLEANFHRNILKILMKFCVNLSNWGERNFGKLTDSQKTPRVVEKWFPDPS